MRSSQIASFRLQTPDSRQEQEKLKKTCREFESIFLAYLMKRMRATVPKSDLFGSRREEEMFRDMLDDEVSRAASEKRGLGLADLIYKQLSAPVRKFGDASTPPQPSPKGEGKAIPPPLGGG